MRSSCGLDRERELFTPPDKPFKPTLFTYINRAQRRLSTTEKERPR